MFFTQCSAVKKLFVTYMLDWAQNEVYPISMYMCIGCGKSSILRVLRGLWSPLRGHATLCCDDNPHTIMFLPQTLYLTSGSLLDQVTHTCTLHQEYCIIFQNKIYIVPYTV